MTEEHLRVKYIYLCVCVCGSVYYTKQTLQQLHKKRMQKWNLAVKKQTNKVNT